MSLADRDSRGNLHEAIKDRRGRLGNGTRGSASEDCRAIGCQDSAAFGNLRSSGDDAECNGCSKDLKVMVVDLVLQTLFSNLIQPVELVKVHGIAVRHDETVEDNDHAPLLAETAVSHLLGFTKSYRPLGDEDMLMIVRIDRIRDKHLDRTNGVTVEAVHQNGINGGPFIDHIGLAGGRVNVDLWSSLGCRRVGTHGAS